MAKTLKENVSCKFVKAVKSTYATVKLCIKYKNSFSHFFDSQIGLKQGDPSSPILFMLFVNDMIDSINSNINDIFTIDDIKLFKILFADDQVVSQNLHMHYNRCYRTSKITVPPGESK